MTISKTSLPSLTTPPSTILNTKLLSKLVAAAISNVPLLAVILLSAVVHTI